VCSEEGTPDQFFGIDGASMHTGTPSRVSGKRHFEFEPDGSATWLFIYISPD
jgi:hypothetical protein